MSREGGRSRLDFWKFPGGGIGISPIKKTGIDLIDALRPVADDYY
ncbi:MAG: hypothetical protein ACYTEQ_18895 [Planctomycetota bacterium]|jgi:hypothetical protein